MYLQYLSSKNEDFSVKGACMLINEGIFVHMRYLGQIALALSNFSTCSFSATPTVPPLPRRQPRHSTQTRRHVQALTLKFLKLAIPIPPPTSLTFYSAYCFSLSPTHNTWARLTAAQVHALRERTGFEGTYIFFFILESALYFGITTTQRNLLLITLTRE